SGRGDTGGGRYQGHGCPGADTDGRGRGRRWPPAAARVAVPRAGTLLVVVMAPQPAEQPEPALVARAAVRGVGVGIVGDGRAADQGDQKYAVHGFSSPGGQNGTPPAGSSAPLGDGREGV